MFGHDDDTQPTQDASALSATSDGMLTVPAPAAADPAAAGYGAGGFATPDPVVAPETTPIDPAHDTSTLPQPAGVTPVATDEPAAPQESSEDLLEIKQQALQQLSPLVGHLEQTPEEKFRTTMMMIQASDNQALIKEAYAAAQQISEEKIRAQALLDIVNEINYFTQNGNSN